MKTGLNCRLRQGRRIERTEPESWVEAGLRIGRRQAQRVLLVGGIA